MAGYAVFPMLISTAEAVAAPDYRALVLARIDPALPPVIRSAAADLVCNLLTAATLPDRIDALAALVEWIREGGNPESDLFTRGPDRLALVREVVLPDASIAPAFEQAVRSCVNELVAENLFGETGIPGRRGFTGELIDRLLAYVLPVPRDDHDAARLLRRLFPRDRDLEWLASLSPERFVQFATLFFQESPLAHDGPGSLADAFADGFRLLAARALAEGLDDRLRARMPRGPVIDSPFLRLNRATDDVLAAWRSGGDIETAASLWRAERAGCRALVAEVQRRLQSEGTSVDIVFALEVIDRCLTRMSLMLEVIEAPPGAARVEAVHRLIVLLVDGAHEDRRVGELVRWNLRLLGRRLVDRSGDTREPYVATARDEYRAIWRAAALGGLVIAMVAAVAMLVRDLGLAPFQSGLLAGGVFAVGFLALQAANLALAARQPPLVAATLASMLRGRRDRERLDEIVDFTARVCHSQIAAALANVGLAAVGAVALDAGTRLATGAPLMSPQRAVQTQHALGLWSGTLIYAAVTGVLIWLATLAGGWFDNWSTLRRLPAAIREHPLGRYVGQPLMARLANAWTHNAAGIGTNVALGLMFGLTPALGGFLGLPLDVRHVTLSAAELALATSALWPDGFTFWLAIAIPGLVGTFALNLAVSFGLAFVNAARAYELSAADTLELGRRFLARVATRPLEFILPSRTPLKLPADHVHA